MKKLKSLYNNIEYEMNPKIYFLKPFTDFYRFLGEDASFTDSFKGRVTRKEYWLYILWFYIACILFGIIEGVIAYSLHGDNMSEDLSIFAYIFIWIICFPIFGLAWRRAHDVGWHGVWSLVPIISFVLCLCPSAGPNKYDLDSNEPENTTDAESKITRHNRPPIKKRHNTNEGSGNVNKYPEGKKNY